MKNAEKATSVFCAVMGFLLASTSATETATKGCTFVTVSEADTRMPARNHHSQERDGEDDLRVLSAVMGFLLASASASKTATERSVPSPYLLTRHIYHSWVRSRGQICHLHTRYTRLLTQHGIIPDNYVECRGCVYIA